MCRFSTATFDAFSALGFIDLERYAKPPEVGVKKSQSINQRKRFPAVTYSEGLRRAGRMLSLAVVLNQALPTPASLVNFLVARVTTLACGQQQLKRRWGEGGVVHKKKKKAPR